MRPRATLLLIGAAALAALNSGCVLPPRDLPRQSAIDARQLGLGATAVVPADEAWWQAFDDAQLDALIEHTFAANPSLAQASAQLRSALAQIDAAHAGLLPKASFSGSALRQHAPDNYIIPPPLAGSDFWMAQIGVSLSWDLDFWGRQANALSQARALARSADLERDNTRLLLAAALVQAYVDLYRADAFADIAQQAELQRQHILDLTRQRVAAGLDTRLELREAESALPQARVERAQAQTQADLAVHALAMIAGEGTDGYAAIVRPQLNLDAVLPLPAQLPINLLARRPDVLAARAFDARRINASHRGRLRVEIGRLRKLLDGLGAEPVATAAGYALASRREVAIVTPRTEDDATRVAILLGDGASWSAQRIAESAGISKRTAQRALGELVAGARAIRTGSGRNVRYQRPGTPIASRMLLLGLAPSVRQDEEGDPP